MGYRSDVKIVIQFKTSEELTAFAVEQRMSGVLERARMFTKQNETDWEAGKQDGNKMWWHYPDIKWYDGYAFIESWKELFREIEDSYSNAGWAMARIGEEIDDIHMDCGGTIDSTWEYINVYTASEFNF